MVQYQGEIVIDGPDFWVWVLKHFKDKEIIFETPVFTAWAIELTDIKTKNVHEIDIIEFYGWLNENYSPNPKHETLFNTPWWNKKEQQVEIEFAAGTIHPASWAKSPEWMFKK